MTDSVFDIALERRFVESDEIAIIDVTSSDMLLIRDSATALPALPVGYFEVDILGTNYKVPYYA